MKKTLILAILTVVAISSPVWATPSTTYWTPTTTYIQPYGVGHWTYDTYFYAGDKTSGGALPDLPVDYGFTIGILPLNLIPGVQAEIGVDYLSIGKFLQNTYLNAKIGLTEEKFGVAAQVGIFNFPLSSSTGVNDYNVMHAVVGKTFGPLWAGAAYYTGNATLGTDKSGFGVGATYYLFEGTTYQLTADYYTGKNALGGGGVGLYWYFANGADLLMGPVFYNDKTLNGEWKWTVQIDIDMNLFNK
jgi:hypothetical protein